MASGFFILKDRSCCAMRWTGYDEIIRIVVKELKKIDEGEGLALYLSKTVPKKDRHNDPNQWGTGFIDSETDEMVIGKYLDLRSLTENNQELFWKALQNGYVNLILNGENYSSLNPECAHMLLKAHKLSKRSANPLEHSSWSVLADENYEKLGPGWEP